MLLIIYSIGDFVSLDKLVTISSSLKVFVSVDPILLTESSKEKDDQRLCIIKLTEEVATLRERVKFLEAENERLKKI